MPAYYKVTPGAQQTTNATPSTENDSLFVKPGSLAQMMARYVHLVGKAAGATSLSGIVCRLKIWTSTASSAGTAITPSPQFTAYAAAKSTAAYSASAVTSGTGGPTVVGMVGCGVSGADTWQAATGPMDDGIQIQPSATQSFDCFVSSATASLGYELDVGIAE